MLKRLLEIRERMGIRTPAVAMVGGCAVLSLALWHSRGQEIVGRAVTEAPAALLRAGQLATAARVLVKVGDAVHDGQPLAVLEAPDILARRKEVDARISFVTRRAEVSRLELIRGLKADERTRALAMIEAERDLSMVVAERARRAAESKVVGGMLSEAEKLRQNGLIDPYRAREQEAAYAVSETQAEESSARKSTENRRLAAIRKELAELGVSQELRAATEKLHAAELDVLTRERDELERQLVALTVRAPRAGRVSELVGPGSVVQPGDLVARVSPFTAEQVAWYATPAEGPPQLGERVAYTVTLADGRKCSGEELVNVGSEAMPKPPQLGSILPLDSVGFPVRIKLPERCALPVGLLVELRLERL
jgi:multidrug resistance efflux pump